LTIDCEIRRERDAFSHNALVVRTSIMDSHTLCITYCRTHIMPFFKPYSPHPFFSLRYAFQRGYPSPPHPPPLFISVNYTGFSFAMQVKSDCDGIFLRVFLNVICNGATLIAHIPNSQHIICPFSDDNVSILFSAPFSAKNTSLKEIQFSPTRSIFLLYGLFY